MKPSLNPKFIALNLLLALCIGLVLWEARGRWNEARELRRDTLNVKIRPVAVPKPSAQPKPDAPPATNYADVAMKDLFSKDRNPTVVIEKIEPAKPKPMPPLPVVYGVLSLPSGVRALMAEKAGLASKPVHAGDTVGEFTVTALDSQRVAFHWEDKDIEKKIDELIDRTGPAQAGGGQNIAAQPVQSAPVQAVSSLSLQQQQMQQAQPPGNAQPSGSVIGAELGSQEHSERACNKGDTSAAGAIVDGYRKVITNTPFGATCRWVPAQ